MTLQHLDFLMDPLSAEYHEWAQDLACDLLVWFLRLDPSLAPLHISHLKFFHGRQESNKVSTANFLTSRLPVMRLFLGHNLMCRRDRFLTSAAIIKELYTSIKFRVTAMESFLNYRLHYNVPFVFLRFYVETRDPHGALRDWPLGVKGARSEKIPKMIEFIPSCGLQERIGAHVFAGASRFFRGLFSDPLGIGRAQ